MDHAAAMEHPMDPAQPSPLSPNWGKIMMWLFLMSDAMSFAGLLCAYAAVRMGSTVWPVPSSILGVPLTALNTFILICSSVTMVKAVAAIQKGDVVGLKRFLAATMLGGTTFLGIQAYEWTHLIHQGARLTSNPWGTPIFGAAFFVLTGFHGSHVLSGLIILTITAIRTAMGKTPMQNVEMAGLYWHFVDLVWVFIFTLFYLL